MFTDMQGIQIRASALFIWCLSSLIWSSCTHSSFSIHTAMADNSASVPQPSLSASESEAEATVHIVYLEMPENEELHASHIRTLASVLGSDEAAKKALVYSYRNLGNMFAAKLTPKQVSEISKQPGVLQVIPSTNYQLHSGPAKLNV